MFLINGNPAESGMRCGFYSNVSRGKRKMHDHDDLISSILEPVEDPDFNGDGSSKAGPGATHIPIYI